MSDDKFIRLDDLEEPTRSMVGYFIYLSSTRGTVMTEKEVDKLARKVKAYNDRMLEGGETFTNEHKSLQYKRFTYLGGLQLSRQQQETEEERKRLEKEVCDLTHRLIEAKAKYNVFVDRYC